MFQEQNSKSKERLRLEEQRAKYEQKLRELAFTDIDAALKLGLEMTLVHLANQGNEVSPESREALAWLNK